MTVDAETGEIVSQTTRTAEQEEGFQKKLRDAADYEARGHVIRKQCDELGGFTWLIYNTGQVLDLGLKPDELTKLIYLSTYMNYDNYLAHPNGDKMIRQSVEHLLDVGRTKFITFFNRVKELGILIEESAGNKDRRYLKLNDQLFIKGDGKLDQVEVGKDTIRLYANAIRELYNKSMSKEHKLLSYIYQAIPFVNVRYNVLCTNPDEQNLDHVNTFSITKFAELIGYDTENVGRLKLLLKRLTVRTETAFGFVESGNSNSIFINPRIYYGGNNYNEVKILGKFCEDRGVGED